MRAERPPEREAGWYTLGELAEALGRPKSTIEGQVKSGVASGKYECKSVLSPDAAGRLSPVKVYRLKGG
jgi:hypothetical protein